MGDDDDLMCRECSFLGIVCEEGKDATLDDNIDVAFEDGLSGGLESSLSGIS